ncbi:MAG: endolytic transglycosylase MltG [Carboxydocellales bacterium]
MIIIYKIFSKLTLITLVIFGIMMLALGGVYYYYRILLEPIVMGQNEPVKIEIPSGSSTITVARLLEKEGLIKNALAFRLYTRYIGQDMAIMAGEYQLSAGMSVPELLDRLTSGKVVSYPFTIPEGFTLKQITTLLTEKGYVNRDKFIEVIKGTQFNYQFLQGIPRGEKYLEGYLFPATYKVVKGTPEQEIVDMMLKRFEKEITPAYLEKARALGLNVNQAVTLASLIERETMQDSERPIVAAVILNRLRKGMRLEIDATVQYALGENKERLFYKDLKIESPYNTYQITGLPPGPIASPGRASLQAAVNPAAVDYLFYVVSTDGKHVFSKTLEEHNRNKRKYLARLKS